MYLTPDEQVFICEVVSLSVFLGFQKQIDVASRVSGFVGSPVKMEDTVFVVDNVGSRHYTLLR